VVKSQYEFSYYDNQLGWVGSLQYMKPGLGYMLSATVGDTFNYPVSSLFGKLSMEEKEVKPLIYSFTPGVYEKNMSVIAKGNICNQALSDGNYYLGAFDNSGYLRGYAIPAYMDATDEYLFFITLHGNIEGENIYFRYFNNITGEEIIADEKISFASNQLSGLPANPYIINVADSASCPAQTLSDNSLSQNVAEKFITVSPNPFTDNLMIKLKGLPEDAVVSLINPLGEVIYSAVAGRKQWVKIDTISLAKGVYFIRILGTDLNEQTKVVKIN
jgi:hypothetical protein